DQQPRGQRIERSRVSYFFDSGGAFDFFHYVERRPPQRLVDQRHPSFIARRSAHFQPFLCFLQSSSLLFLGLYKIAANSMMKPITTMMWSMVSPKGPNPWGSVSRAIIRKPTIKAPMPANMIR